MIRTRYLILFMVFLTLLLAPIVHAESINDLAYQNRFLLKAGTILNDEQNGEWTGIGDCLIFPYYDARQVDGMKQTTVIKIKNISEYGIVAKLRVRESSLGAEVFSKDIWIPSSSLSDDVGWQGTIEINAAGNNAVISSFDSIVSRNDTNSFYLSKSLSSGIPFSTRNIQKKNSGSILYGYIEVIGEEKTSPQNINGKVGRLASTERDCPNTLLGKGIVNRPDEGVSMAYDAVAIGNFSRGQGSLFRSIGSPYPRLDTCEDTLDQLEFQLSKSEVYAPYALDPSNQGKTSLIITYPTKFFHYQNGSRIDQVNNPFEGLTETQGELVETALSEQGQEFMDSSITLPYSVNVIGLYKDYNGKPFGIDNVTMPTFSSEFGEATLTSGNLSQRVLIADYEYYKEGRFVMYKGLPAVGLVLQESQDSGQVNATLTAVEYSTNWIASNVEVISTPATPSGPVFGLIGTSYAFAASGSSSSLGHPIEYQFDWGDGTTSPWGSATQSETWTAGGVFTVRARARCAIDTSIVSKWSNGLVVTIDFVSVPTLLSGPTQGIPNQSYSYTASGAISTARDPLEYQFDWGDGTTSPWGPATQSKTWTTGGVFTVRARARSATYTSVVSDWTPGLTVTIEIVSTPSTPVGPSFGNLGGLYSFSTGGSTSNLSHPVEYQFDWGDGTLSPWGSSSQSKSWNSLGTFVIKARARDVISTSVMSDWSSGLTFDIETISNPSPPTGPTNGMRGIPYTYTASGAIVSSGHTLEYQFDWNGDGITNLSAWGGASQSNVWTNSGTYTVRVRARDSIHPTIVTGWSSGLVVVIESVNSSITLTGPTSGVVNQTYPYVVGGASSDGGDPIQYLFDWGDGTNSGWLDVGVLSVGKAWANPGNYTVRAQARSATYTGVISDWSAGLTVTISPLPPQSESISVPSTPVGPNLGNLGVFYSFSTGGSISSLGHSVEYQFDWGDGTLSPWGSSSPSKSWNSLGTFVIKARARCVIDTSVVSDWSSGLTFDIETISNPSPPTGPTNGMRGIPYTYTASGVIVSSGHTLEYQFDWNGDGTTDLSTWGGTSQTQVWTNSGIYTVRVRARDSAHPTIVTGWSPGLVVVIEFVNPPTTLTGPTSGTVGQIYPYVVGGSSSDRGDPIQYQFDWGDGTNSGWLSVGVVSVGKTWANPGIYVVKAQARCFIHSNAISDWSPGITVNINPLPPQSESISVPSAPVGPNLGNLGVFYSFSTGGSISTLAHPVEYQFDWGDGTLSSWGLSNRSESWNSLGTFVIKARARCVIDTGVMSDWSSGLTFDIEVISDPSPPTGPTNGMRGIPYSYTASGAIVSSGHTLEYQFDWNGNGTTDLSAWGGVSQSNIWTNSGIYTVRVRARDSVHPTIVSNWSSGLVVVIEFVNPPTTLTGPTSGTVGQIYPYVVGGASSDRGNPVQYQFDWGDGTNSGWLSVGVISVGKAWANPGTYTIKAHARSAINTGVISDWSAGLTVTISPLPPQSESISVPSTPVGPNLGNLGIFYSFSTGGSISSLGHPVEYQFDWGNGTFSPWGSSTQSTSWSNYGTFVIKARARCVIDTSVMSDWSSGLSFVIDLVTTPSQPFGPLSVMRGQANTYTVSGASSIVNDPLEYQFDWGDGSTSAWIAATVDSHTGLLTASQDKIWTTSGAYTVRARARNSIYPTIVSGWSSGVLVVVEFVSTPVAPTGPTSGTVGTGYQYTTGGSSSDRGYPVQYQFDWGDGTTSEWLPIGTTSLGKAWTQPGTYAVRAHAASGVNTNVISDWSPVLTVTMFPGPPPLTEVISAPFIEAYGGTVPTNPRGSIYIVSDIISGRKNIPYTFTFQPGVSNLGHAVESQFDWGDGTMSDWVASSSSKAKAWPISGTYLIKVISRDQQDQTVLSDWSSGLYIVIDYISTPNTAVWQSPPPNGIGVVGTSYTFSTGGSVSDIGQDIEYRFHWGDTTNSDSGWLPVGLTTASYTYTTPGTYTVRVDARGAWYLGAGEDPPSHTEHISYYSQELMVTIRPSETVSAPPVLSGPTIGLPNTTYTYSTGGAVSSLGQPVQYLFNWGDGTDSNWLPVGVTSAQKAWPIGGTYNVTAMARDAINTSVVSGNTTLVVKIELISAPTTPVGPSQGIPGNTFTYMTGGASSNINAPIEYQIDWAGDGSDLSSWQSSTNFTKTWAHGGNFSVKARARDANNILVMSDWSNGLTVKIELITVSTPTGPTTVARNTSGTYSATGSSNIGDPVQIRFLFSDGGDSGFLPVGTTSFSKTWTSVGSFIVAAQARCAIHTSNVSALSAPLAVAVNNPVPTTTSILPTSKTAGDTAFTLTVNGTNFVSTSVVRFGGSDRTTTFVNSTQLTAAILTADLTTAGTVDITVFNPAPIGGTSNPQTFTVSP